MYDFIKYICLVDCLTQRFDKPGKYAGDSVTASFVIKQETRTEGRRSNRYEFINDPRNRSWSLTVEWDGGEAVGKGGGKERRSHAFVSMLAF